MRKTITVATKVAAHASKYIFNHLLDEKKPVHHRLLLGVVIAYSGVLLSKTSIGGICGHIIFDGIGYFFHAVGAIPFVDSLHNWCTSSEDAVSTICEDIAADEE